jgi:hypothetical protein
MRYPALENAVSETWAESAAIAAAIEKIESSGWEIGLAETTLRILLKPQLCKQQSDADFLRDMRITPDITPVRRKRFARWPRKKYSVALLIVWLFGASLLTGCANIHVELGCQSTAPILTNTPSHTIQRHPACGLQR